MTSDGTIEGTRLPEATRLQYLEAMGISCWKEQQTGEASGQQTMQQETARPAVEAEPPAAQTWPLLQQQVASCSRCEQLAAHRTQTVFGTGDQAADLLVIGEAPGRDEDIRGEPFVGRAGQLLNAMLKAIGFEREQVYIANILKCRPPDNRDPTSDEAANCSGYLQQQIELIAPKVILVVGRIAAQNLLGSQEAIGRLRGGQHQYQGIPVVVTYHPAYLLRPPSEKRKSWQDLLRLKQMM